MVWRGQGVQGNIRGESEVYMNSSKSTRLVSQGNDLRVYQRMLRGIVEK